jgi:hypothetical protein
VQLHEENFMTEIAVNTPFESNEVKDIICQELRNRLDTLGPLQGAKEYASFDVGFNVTIRVRRVGEGPGGRDTLAWGHVERGPVHEPLPEGQKEEMVAANFNFNSGDPNEERQSRGMPLNVESRDGRGNITRKKVTVKE